VPPGSIRPAMRLRVRALPGQDRPADPDPANGPPAATLRDRNVEAGLALSRGGARCECVCLAGAAARAPEVERRNLVRRGIHLLLRRPLLRGDQLVDVSRAAAGTRIVD
jgi:hypothetical protein